MVDSAGARLSACTQKLANVLLRGERFGPWRQVIWPLLVGAAALLGAAVVYGTSGGDAVSLEPSRPALAPLTQQRLDSNGPQFAEEFSLGSWPAPTGPQTPELAAGVGGSRATLLAAEEPALAFEQDTAAQRRDRELRTQAAYAARQRAEHGMVQNLEEPSAQAGAEAPSTSAANAPAPAQGSELARALQLELKRVGCDPGKVNGEWSVHSRRALEHFNRRAGTKLATQSATPDALTAVKAQNSRVCAVSCPHGHPGRNGACVVDETSSVKPARITHREPAHGRAGARPRPADSSDPMAAAASPGEKNCFTLEAHIFCR